jgi:hypothetical protein
MAGSLEERNLRDEVRKAIEELEGVEQVAIDGPPWRILLLVSGEGSVARAEAAARASVSREGIDPDSITILAGYSAAPEPRRRIRFCGARIQRLRTGWAQAEVVLEWGGRETEASAEGESSPSGELRLVAQATLDALEALLDTPLGITLVGAKATRVFDTDLVVVVLRSTEGSQSLTGAALVRRDFARACSVAVLHATNRRLGNFLAVTD